MTVVLDDRHINYLILVRRGIIRLWWAPRKITSKYVCTDWSKGQVEVDQTVAAQMKALGATRIVIKAGEQYLALTERGEGFLVDDDEAWG